MKCNWQDKQTHGYSRPIIFRSYFGLQQADLRPIICRSYSDLILFYSRSILGRWYAELFRSYFGLQQADLISALGETRAWLQAKPPWLQAKYTMVALKCSPDHTLLQRTLCIMNTCFWLMETCTKCSYFIEENIRPGAQRLAFEVQVYRPPATKIPLAGVLHFGKFPDNRRSICWKHTGFLIFYGLRYFLYLQTFLQLHTKYFAFAQITETADRGCNAMQREWPVALPHNMRMVRTLQHQFTRSW